MTTRHINTTAAKGGHARITVRTDTLNPEFAVYMSTGTAVSLSHADATALCQALLDVMDKQKRGQE